MQVSIRLYANLRRCRQSAEGGADFSIHLDPGASVASALRKLALPYTEDLLLVLNGRRVEPDTPLKEGDRLAILPALGGG